MLYYGDNAKYSMDVVDSRTSYTVNYSPISMERALQELKPVLGVGRMFMHIINLETGTLYDDNIHRTVFDLFLDLEKEIEVMRVKRDRVITTRDHQITQRYSISGFKRGEKRFSIDFNTIEDVLEQIMSVKDIVITNVMFTDYYIDYQHGWRIESSIGSFEDIEFYYLLNI